MAVNQVFFVALTVMVATYAPIGIFIAMFVLYLALFVIAWYKNPSCTSSSQGINLRYTGAGLVLSAILISWMSGFEKPAPPIPANTASNIKQTVITSSVKSDNYQPPTKQMFNYTCNVSGVGKVRGRYVNDVGVAIVEIKQASTIGRSSYSRVEALGVFRIIRVVATNNQRDAITLSASSYVLVDDQGREYSHSINGDSALSSDDKKTWFLETLNPGLTMSGYISFDVPKNAKIVSLRFSGGFSGRFAELPFEVLLDN